MRYHIFLVIAAALVLGACGTARPSDGEYDRDLMGDLIESSTPKDICIEATHVEDARDFADILDAESCRSDSHATTVVRVKRIYYRDTNELRVDVVVYKRVHSGLKAALPLSSTGVLVEDEGYDHAAHRLIERDRKYYVGKIAHHSGQ